MSGTDNWNLFRHIILLEYQANQDENICLNKRETSVQSLYSYELSCGF